RRRTRFPSKVSAIKASTASMGSTCWPKLAGWKRKAWRLGYCRKGRKRREREAETPGAAFPPAGRPVLLLQAADAPDGCASWQARTGQDGHSGPSATSFQGR